MTNQKQLAAALEELVVAVRLVADEECQAAPSWLFEQTQNSLDRLSNILDQVNRGALSVGAEFSLNDELGESWVDLESDVRDLVLQIDSQFFKARQGA